ncbi:hypothetical protein [Paraburkholderia sp. BL17N1]|uniref:hypothetical protein n=1 Tax=Paraburkholderia sp. BL17N1 TaxID=1938798 RepID=UPI0011C442D8|nr:hypothetical protein [Paraburkholderia sp. BL17N1]
MKKKWIGILFVCAPLLQAFAQDVSGSSTTVAVQNAKFVFSCRGSLGSQFITVSAADGHSGDLRLVAPQRLDETDDCAQVTWTVQPEKSGAQIIMANPGRLGLDAQMLVFYADRDGVDFSGQLPVAADALGTGQFRVIGADAYGTWERIYAFKNHKLYVERELILMRTGGVCLERSGTVKMNLRCAGPTTHATPKKNVCVRARNGKVEQMPLRACTSLEMRR